MNILNTRSATIAPSSGVLFKRTTSKDSRAHAKPLEISRKDSRGGHRLAFRCVYLFTLLVYLRPHEVMPGVFGGLQLPKLVAISAILIYTASKLSAGESVIIWTVEVKMVALLWTLGLLLVPFAASPGDSFNVLFDPLIKILLIFIMQISLIDTRSRLRKMLGIMVFCETLYAFSSINTFFSGGYAETSSFHTRITGWGNQFGNPNDIACVLALMLPFTVIFALISRGFKRWLFFACAGLSALAILLTFSRSGFIALALASGLIIWKFARGRRLKIALPVIVVVAVLFAAMPGKYKTRLSTIFNPQTDTTNSAQERQEQMLRGVTLAVTRPIVGVGMGNFHIYGIKELRAHNAFLETAAELGMLGLIAFLIIIFAPWRSLRRIERETAANGARPDTEKQIVSVCLQASFAAFIIYAFFGSIQYDSYLYYLVAFSVALRRIDTAEVEESAHAGDGAALPELKAPDRPTRGSLWRSREFRGRRLKAIGGSR
ncbi:MAG TPA: O-antigen ligase family protein [Blastocatellia bacterium]|nr:O-antigen ligase family protein [Blastocatellia bacterium]